MRKRSQSEGAAPLREVSPPEASGMGHVRWMGSLVLLLFVLSGLSRGSEPTLGPAPLPGVSLPTTSLRPEFLEYDIGFLWFRQVARGEISLQPEGPAGRFIATLEAKTQGFIGWLTLYRRHIYRSFLRFDPLLQRLTSTRFVKVETVRQDSSETVTELDYVRREMTWRHYENGVLDEEGREPIPPGVIYEDILSAFYNLREGFYGPLHPGKRLTLTTLPLREQPKSKKLTVRSFDIRVATPEEEAKERRRFPQLAREGLLAIVRIPKEIFRQKTGEVRIWFGRDLIPLSAVVEDAIFYGDVKGWLTSSSRPPEPRETSLPGLLLSPPR
jgi:hypothetical protein